MRCFSRNGSVDSVEKKQHWDAVGIPLKRWGGPGSTSLHSKGELISQFVILGSLQEMDSFSCGIHIRFGLVFPFPKLGSAVGNEMAPTSHEFGVEQETSVFKFVHFRRTF